jgi:hypothetical protein
MKVVSISTGFDTQHTDKKVSIGRNQNYLDSPYRDYRTLDTGASW